MSYIYKTKGTCSTQIELDLDGDVVHNVKLQEVATEILRLSQNSLKDSQLPGRGKNRWN